MAKARTLAEDRKELAQHPGRSWRVSCEPGKGTGGARFDVRDTGDFDELVVDHWLHLEKMDTRAWWLRVGERTLWVIVKEDGSVSVTDTSEGSPAEVEP